MSANEVQALISLLGEDDPRILQTVVARLASLGTVGEAALTAATDHQDPRIRTRARSLLRRFQADRGALRLSALLSKDTPDLEEACILLAQVESPDLDPNIVHREFDRLGARLAELLGGSRSTRYAARCLARLLHHEEGFRGNADCFYDPRNSYISEVLRRRLGIPISLSAIYILTGRRAGLDLVGVGMPMHFLVGLKGPEHLQLIDPYGGGRTLTREACRTLLAGYRHSFREDYLRPVSDREMLGRMMANLVRIYHGKGDQPRLARLYEFVNALQGRA